jgi:hypothetical protein
VFPLFTYPSRVPFHRKKETSIRAAYDVFVLYLRLLRLHFEIDIEPLSKHAVSSSFQRNCRLDRKTTEEKGENNHKIFTIAVSGRERDEGSRCGISAAWGRVEGKADH